ncbi:MAG: hypothetical protein ABI548_27620 [Polyangiaceae bacterium]
MSDNALEFTEERGLGKVLGRVRLDSGIPLADGARSRATLLLTASGLWLVAARDRFHGLCVDLLTHGDVRLVSGRIRDRLCFGQEALIIPAGRRHAVERLLALGRLASATREPALVVKRSRLVQEPDELGRAWLARELAPGEVLVCWLRGANSVTLQSQLLGPTETRPHLFMTDRRAAVVAWSPVGDVIYTALHAQALRVRAQGEQTELSTEGTTFLSRRADAQGARDAIELLSLDQGKARLLEAARRLWLSRESAREEAARSISLLQAAIAQGSQRARFARWLALTDETDPKNSVAIDLAEVARALTDGRLTPAALAELWASWRFSEASGRALVRGLLDAGANAFAHALQRRVHETPSADEASARDELRLAQFAVDTRLGSAGGADERFQALREILGEHGLEATPAQPIPASNALSSELINETLTHPLARGQGSLVAGVQKLIAHSPAPDHGALSDYCEALDAQQHPEARRALDAARLAFSLPALHAYVSRGKKSLGLRGYEAQSPYLLLGKDHLDVASPFCMSEAELFFAIGAEALHLLLGQARLTSNEIWAGAFAHTKGGVELVLSLLPLAQGIPLGPSVARFLEKIPEPALRRGLDALVRFEHGRRKVPAAGATSALSHVNENLLEAHRLMQMSADRAGLVLSGDLRASLRALLLVRPDTRALLDAMTERDIVSVLLDPSERDLAMRADLTVRFAALFDFYCSADYVALRRALCG